MKTTQFSLLAALAMTAVLALPGIAAAQDPQGPAGSTYVQETHGDWEVRCLRRDAGGDPCQLYQQMVDAEGRPIAEINLFDLPAESGAAAGAVIITPLETLLTERLALQIGTRERKRYPFAWCNVNGCISRIGFTADEVEALKLGVNAIATVVSVSDPTQPIELTISLRGFTAGFAAIDALNANVQR